MQDGANSLNGTVLEDPTEVGAIVRTMRQRIPFLAELIGENGRTLLLGLGSADGCVQFSSSDGDPPYLMALENPEEEGWQDFLCGGTPTPVPRRYCLPMQKVIAVAVAFLETGEPYPAIEWEEI
jgi:hypothetical protein